MTPVKAGSEAAWQMVVENLAGFGEWGLSYHTHDSRRSQKGWPDYVFCREATDEFLPELLVVELKAETTRVQYEQLRWLAALRSCGVEAYLWRPSDKPAVEARLLRPRAPRVGTEGPGVCASCESQRVFEVGDDRFRCVDCQAVWSGLRKAAA